MQAVLKYHDPNLSDHFILDELEKAFARFFAKFNLGAGYEVEYKVMGDDRYGRDALGLHIHLAPTGDPRHDSIKELEVLNQMAGYATALAETGIVVEREPSGLLFKDASHLARFLNHGVKNKDEKISLVSGHVVA